MTSAASPPSAPIAIFGGTGFVGRRVVRRLLGEGCDVRVVSRHPETCAEIFGNDNPRLHPMQGDVRSDEDVEPALEGAKGVLNAVSLYTEVGGVSFRSIHVEGAARIARLSRTHGVRRAIQISGIGADIHSHSRYISARGAGEVAVREEFPNAIIVRPSVMFGLGDGFITSLVGLVKRSPVVPLFGRGETRLQPVYVEDVASSLSLLLSDSEDAEPTYELGGPRIYRFREVVECVAQALSVRRMFVPLPFAVWTGMTKAGRRLSLPGPTLSQVELMEVDNVARTSQDLLRLGVQPTPLEDVLPDIIAAGA